MAEMIDPKAFDAYLAATLRGDGAPWPDSWLDARTMATFAERIDFHGIAGLLYSRAEALHGWPSALIDLFRDTALTQAFWESSHRAVITRLIEALNDDAVPSMVLKGTALAYSLYDDPSLRRRGDTDLLIHKADLAAARAILAQAGFHKDTGYLYQESWVLQTSDGFAHCLDLHWQVLNAPALRDVLVVEECFAGATPLPRLSPSARACDRLTLFVHGCINQAWHEKHGIVAGDHMVRGGDRLIWALDNHLIAQTFWDADWSRLVALTSARGIAAPCLQGLELAATWLRTPVPPAVMARLAAHAEAERAEAARGQPDTLSQIAANLGAVAGLRDRLTYLWIVLFLPARHKRTKYPEYPRWPLPLLYLRRMAGAARRLLSGGRH